MLRDAPSGAPQHEVCACRCKENPHAGEAQRAVSKHGPSVSIYEIWYYEALRFLHGSALPPQTAREYRPGRPSLYLDPDNSGCRGRAPALAGSLRATKRQIAAVSPSAPAAARGEDARPGFDPMRGARSRPCQAMAVAAGAALSIRETGVRLRGRHLGSPETQAEVRAVSVVVHPAAANAS